MWSYYDRDLNLVLYHCRYIDFINVMAYDFYGPWSTVTGFTGPLYSRYSNAAFNTEFSQVI